MDRIEAQARYFRNLPFRDRSIKAVVHLEDTDDISFWSHQLKNVSQANYRFLSYSKNDNGRESRGCEQCLRYKPYLNSKFFICIDSDLRQLRGETGLTADNYVAQTYTYSWENHFCEAEHLQRRFAALIPESEFDFVAFLQNLSIVLYRPLLYLVYCSRNIDLNQNWNISKFNACLPLQPRPSELADNGKGYIAKVSLLFEKALIELGPLKLREVECLNTSNAYLHIQGHQLYKLVLHIGTMLCRKNRISFKTDILDVALHTGGYEEIDAVQKDLKIITAK